MEKAPQLGPELVRDFVIAGHGDQARTHELLERHPKLLNAAWDWGGGDWETALGGAAHTGSREVAEFLLQRGARLDIFAAAMLGKLEIVKSILKAYPSLAEAPGPHGIPLLAHAQAGGERAKPVTEYLAVHA